MKNNNQELGYFTQNDGYEEELYKQKYLKYKQKYLELKGAGNPPPNNPPPKKTELEELRANQINYNSEKFKKKLKEIVSDFQSTHKKELPNLTHFDDFQGIQILKLKAGTTFLKNLGYPASYLKTLSHNFSELVAAGFTASELKAADFTASQLKAAGFTASQLKDASFNASQLKEAKFTALELQAVGFNASQIKAGGYRLIDFRGTSLLKDLGIDKPTVEALKAAGFSADEIIENDPKLTKIEFVNAGFTDSEREKLKFSS
jgi:hypothetical protein